MPQPRGYNSFPETGWPSVCKVWWSTSAGLMTGAGLDGTTGKPGAGKHIHVIGVISQSDSTIKTNNGSGSIVFSIPGDADGLRFPGAVDMGADTALFVDGSNDVTVFYYIHDTATQ